MNRNNGIKNVNLPKVVDNLLERIYTTTEVDVVGPYVRGSYFTAMKIHSMYAALESYLNVVTIEQLDMWRYDRFLNAKEVVNTYEAHDAIVSREYVIMKNILRDILTENNDSEWTIDAYKYALTDDVLLPLMVDELESNFELASMLIHKLKEVVKEKECGNHLSNLSTRIQMIIRIVELQSLNNTTVMDIDSMFITEFKSYLDDDDDDVELREVYANIVNAYNTISANTMVSNIASELLEKGSVDDLNTLFDNLLCADIVMSYVGLEDVPKEVLRYVMYESTKTIEHYELIRNVITYLGLYVKWIVDKLYNSDQTAEQITDTYNTLSNVKQLLADEFDWPVADDMPESIQEKYVLLKAKLSTAMQCTNEALKTGCVFSANDMFGREIKTHQNESED